MGEQLTLLGVLLMMSSGILFQIKVMTFSRFLRLNCPQIWERHVTNGGRANFLVRYHKLKSLPLEYESDNQEVDRRLKSLALVGKFAYVGILFLGIGATMQLIG